MVILKYGRPIFRLSRFTVSKMRTVGFLMCGSMGGKHPLVRWVSQIRVAPMLLSVLELTINGTTTDKSTAQSSVRMGRRTNVLHFKAPSTTPSWTVFSLCAPPAKHRTFKLVRGFY